MGWGKRIKRIERERRGREAVYANAIDSMEWMRWYACDAVWVSEAEGEENPRYRLLHNYEQIKRKQDRKQRSAEKEKMNLIMAAIKYKMPMLH